MPSTAAASTISVAAPARSSPHRHDGRSGAEARRRRPAPAWPGPRPVRPSRTRGGRAAIRTVPVWSAPVAGTLGPSSCPRWPGPGRSGPGCPGLGRSGPGCPGPGWAGLGGQAPGPASSGPAAGRRSRSRGRLAVTPGPRARVARVPARPAGIRRGPRGSRPGQLGSGGLSSTWSRPGQRDRAARDRRSRPRRPPSPRPGSRRRRITPGRITAAWVDAARHCCGPVTAPGPRSRLVHAERGIVVRPVRVRACRARDRAGSRPPSGAPDPRSCPKEPGSTSGRGGPGIHAGTLRSHGRSPAQPRNPPRAATIRRARIRIVPSWLGHLVSDVSRCGSITSASR